MRRPNKLRLGRLRLGSARPLGMARGPTGPDDAAMSPDCKLPQDESGQRGRMRDAEEGDVGERRGERRRCRGWAAGRDTWERKTGERVSNPLFVPTWLCDKQDC